MGFPALSLNTAKGGGRLSVCSGLVDSTTQFPIALITLSKTLGPLVVINV